MTVFFEKYEFRCYLTPPEMFDRIVPTSIICILIYFVTKINGPRALKCINYHPLGKHFLINYLFVL